jgi:hypothetical protein
VQDWKSEPATRLIAIDDLRHIAGRWRGYVDSLREPTISR